MRFKYHGSFPFSLLEFLFFLVLRPSVTMETFLHFKFTLDRKFQTTSVLHLIFISLCFKNPAFQKALTKI